VQDADAETAVYKMKVRKIPDKPGLVYKKVLTNF